jgi:hypothetical protein
MNTTTPEITWDRLDAQELYEDLLFRRYELRSQQRAAQRSWERNGKHRDLELAETLESWIEGVEDALATAREEARTGWNSNRSIDSHPIMLSDLLAMHRNR